MGIRITDRFWPVVVLQVHDTLRQEDIEGMQRAYRDAFARSGSFVAWSDLRGLRAIPGPAQRRQVAEWLRRIEGDMQESCLGSCNLVSSPIMRGVMTALYWIFTPPVPQGFFATDTEGLAWCTDRLRAGGYEPGAVIEELSHGLKPRPERPGAP